MIKEELTFKEYCDIQISYIQHYAKHFHCDIEDAIGMWIRNHHAEHFSELHKKHIKKA